MLDKYDVNEDGKLMRGEINRMPSAMQAYTIRMLLDNKGKKRDKQRPADVAVLWPLLIRRIPRPVRARRAALV